MSPTKILSAFVVLSLCIGSGACSKKKKEEPKTEAKAEATAKKQDQSASKTADKKEIPAPDNVAAAPADAEKHPGGMASLVLQKGTGDKHPKANDKVKVHYTGWTKDGKMFDSSVVRNRPSTFGLNQVIKGWTEGVQLMVQGEKRRFWIPGEMAYGDTPRRPGAPSGQLTFDIELLEIIAMPDPPETPEDVAAAPKDAKKTKSGIQYRVLKEGTGKKHPEASDKVEVHYSGWTTDGKMFDSSVTRGQPATFALGAVIKGWTEGVQLMVEGEKTRFWIPGGLAYGEAMESVGKELKQLDATLKKECKGAKLTEKPPAEVDDADEKTAKMAAIKFLMAQTREAKGSCEKQAIRKTQGRVQGGRPMGTLVFDIELLKIN